MRKQIGATVLAMAMACSLMAGCSSGSGDTTAAAAAAATEAAKDEAKAVSYTHLRAICRPWRTAGWLCLRRMLPAAILRLPRHKNPIFSSITK